MIFQHPNIKLSKHKFDRGIRLIYLFLSITYSCILKIKFFILIDYELKCLHFYRKKHYSYDKSIDN